MQCTLEWIWSKELGCARISIPDTVRLGVLAVAADGARIFGGFYSAEWSGIVSVDPQGMITQDVALAHFIYERAREKGLGRWLEL